MKDFKHYLLISFLPSLYLLGMTYDQRHSVVHQNLGGKQICKAAWLASPTKDFHQKQIQCYHSPNLLFGSARRLGPHPVLLHHGLGIVQLRGGAQAGEWVCHPGKVFEPA